MLFADAGDFERVPVQMQRMLVTAAIAKDQTVSLAGMHNQWLNFGPRFVVDRPRVELRTVLLADIAKRQDKTLVRLGRSICVGTIGVIPLGRCGILPTRLPRLTCVLDYDAEAHLTRLFQRRAQDPNTR